MAKKATVEQRKTPRRAKAAPKKASSYMSSSSASQFTQSPFGWAPTQSFLQTPPSMKAFEQIEAAFKSFQPQAGNIQVEETLNQAKEQMEKFGLSFFKGYEDMAKTSKENVEAAVKSSQLWAKGAEEVGKEISSLAQNSIEMGMQAGQAMLGIKTFKDLMDLQSDYAKKSFDQMIAGTSKVSDMAVRVANEAFEPLAQSINETIEKVGRKAA